MIILLPILTTSFEPGNIARSSGQFFPPAKQALPLPRTQALFPNEVDVALVCKGFSRETGANSHQLYAAEQPGLYESDKALELKNHTKNHIHDFRLPRQIPLS